MHAEYFLIDGTGIVSQGSIDEFAEMAAQDHARWPLQSHLAPRLLRRDQKWVERVKQSIAANPMDHSDLYSARILIDVRCLYGLPEALELCVL